MQTTKKAAAPRNYRAVDFGTSAMRIKDLAAGIARMRRQVAKLERSIAASERFIQQERNAR